MASEKETVIKGTMLMAAFSALQQIVQFGLQILLAKLLVKEDYGTATIVTTIGGFAIILSSVGISAALVQRKNISKSLLDSTATITCSFAASLGLIILLTAPIFAKLYHAPELTLLLRCEAFDIIIKVLLSLYDAIMLRNLWYSSLAIRSLIGLCTQAIVAVSLAYFGYGPLAIVLGYISGSFTQLILCIIKTKYFPRFNKNWKEAKEVISFGIWVLSGKICSQMAYSLDGLIMGFVLNLATLGLYGIAKQLVNIAPQFFLGIVFRITLPIFARHQDDRTWIEQNYWRGISINSIIGFPLALLVAIYSYQILGFIYGTKWLEAAILMKYCAPIIMATAIDSGYFTAIFQSIGKPQVVIIIQFLALIVHPLCAYASKFVGVNRYAILLACAYIFYFSVELALLKKHLNFNYKRIFPTIAKPLLLLIPTAATAIALRHYCFHDASEVHSLITLKLPWFIYGAKLAFCAFASLCIYALCAYFLCKAEVQFLISGIFGKLRSRR